jgi:hypothetical protein
MSHSYAIVTNLLQTVSMQVLVDWVDFFDTPPSSIVCYFGGNRDAETLLQDFCDTRGITLIVAPDDLTEDIRKLDMPVLRWQFANVPEDYCVRVSLDTLPFRNGRDGWFEACIDTMEAEDLVYATGSTRKFRTDQAHPTPGYVLTQRVSFNFIVMRPQRWLELERQYAHLEKVYDRFHCEGFLEDYCRETGRYGLRLENGTDFRIFHVQIWDERMLEVRDNFRAGRGIGPFITGYEDDQLYEWTMYYMHPKPPLPKRIRIEMGRLRQKLLAG